MKKNKIIISILFLIIISIASYFLITHYIKNKNISNKEQITPLMYEITKENSNNKVYLFGSIHLANLSEFNFPKYVEDAYKNSHYIACEADIVEYQKDTQRQINDVMKMLYQDGTTIKDHLSSQTYTKLVNLLKEKKLYSSLYDNYKPYFFESLLTMALTSDAKININTGIDTYFLQKAKKEKKEILEIESAEFQNALLLSFSDQLYELILSETIDNYDNEVNNLKELYKAWMQGDKEKILEFSNDDIDIKQSYTNDQIKQIENYNYKLITERNINMTNKLEEYFNNDQDVFFMVGTLHLLGDKGIAHLLENKGFIVKQINN